MGKRTSSIPNQWNVFATTSQEGDNTNYDIHSDIVHYFQQSIHYKWMYSDLEWLQCLVGSIIPVDIRSFCHDMIQRTIESIQSKNTVDTRSISYSLRRCDSVKNSQEYKERYSKQCGIATHKKRQRLV
jgi:hypothetical protein